MTRKLLREIMWGNFALIAGLTAAVLIQPRNAQAQDSKAPYPNMAPLEQYLMADRNAEIALARTAAPKSISDDASVVVLDPKEGYVTAVKGKNGFVCIVERAWMSPFTDQGFWNPKNRSPICYNAPAARTILLYTYNRTKMVLAGLTRPQILERVDAQVAKKELPVPDPGALSYMLSKDGYLNDQVGHWHPHLMFHMPKIDTAELGANFDDSPVLADPRGMVEPETIFFVPVGKWSDGTPASAM